MHEGAAPVSSDMRRALLSEAALHLEKCIRA